LKHPILGPHFKRVEITRISCSRSFMLEIQLVRIRTKMDLLVNVTRHTIEVLQTRLAALIPS